MNRGNSLKNKAQIEDLFEKIDVKKKGYIEFGQIVGVWGLIEELVNNDLDFRRLKGYVERYYKETKITRTVLLKIMSSFIVDN